MLFVRVEDERDAVAFTLARFDAVEHVHCFIERCDRVAEQPNRRAW